MKIIQLRNRWWRWLGLTAVSAMAGAIMVVVATYLYLAPQLPQAAALRQVEYQIPLRIFASDGPLLGEFGEKRRTPLTYDQIPINFIKAILSAEDERFFRHGGVDFRGLARAALELLWYQDIRSGGSTITMQVARNFFLDREQKFLRKFNEIVLAIEIEKKLSKEEILALYLNKIYLGHRAYGAEAAAQVYYGQSLAELTLAQQAMIAGLPKAPSAYNPITNPERAMTRRNWILRRMRDLGAISAAQYDSAVAEPNSATYHGANPDVDAAYLAEMVRREMISRYGAESAYTEGFRVITTVSSERQRAAVRAVRDGLHAYDERHGWRGALGKLDSSALPDMPAGAIREPDEASTHEGEQLVDPGEQQTETAADVDAQDRPVSNAEAIAAEAETGDSAIAIEKEERALRSAWRSALKPWPGVGNLEAAVTVQVSEDEVRLVNADAQVRVLPFEQLAWAAPYESVERIGTAPQTPADVLAVGDVVFLRQTLDEQGQTVWRLAQQPQVQSALASLDPRTGALQALVGGYSFAGSHFNRVIQGERQAGSSFKPFIYTAGIRSGMTPATLINDAPIVFEDAELETAWRPTGAGSRFYGPTRLREALYRSLNLVSIRLLKQVGIGNAVATLKDFGLPTRRFPRDLSLALGSAALTPLELATAYTTFASGGFRVEPYFIDRIESNEGEVLWQAPAIILCDAEPCVEERPPLDNAVADQPVVAESGPVQPEPLVYQRRIDARTAWLMDSMLKDVVRRGTAHRARELGRRDLAGKTGTTNDQFDAWFSGYSPALVATVWVGFDDPQTLGRGEYGGRAALPIWMDYMGTALQDVPEQQFPQPEGIVSVRINAETGKRVRPGAAGGIFEYFLEENLPEEETAGAIPEDAAGPAPEQLF